MEKVRKIYLSSTNLICSEDVGKYITKQNKKETEKGKGEKGMKRMGR